MRAPEFMGRRLDAPAARHEAFTGRLLATSDGDERLNNKCLWSARGVRQGPRLHCQPAQLGHGDLMVFWLNLNGDEAPPMRMGGHLCAA
jgi:hypothetical protein